MSSVTRIPVIIKLLYIYAMKTVDEIRRDNMRILQSEAGSATKAANMMRWPLPQFSNLRDGVPDSQSGKRRGMRPDTARKLEKAFGKPEGWLDKDHSTNKPDVIRYDLLDVRAACGDGAINEDYPDVIYSLEMPSEIAHRLIGRVGKNVKIIRAVNDSMTPTINSGDMLFVDISVQDFRGREGIYLIFHGGGLICKRLSMAGKALMVTSDNSGYPTWTWDEKMDDTRIVGKVICSLPLKFENF